MGEKEILARIQDALQSGQIKISLHAAEEAIAEEISRTDILQVLVSPIILDNYPTWWLGPCCLLYGQTSTGRDLHIVSSYSNLPITIVTVYEPKPPKWITPTQRGGTK